MDKDAILDLVDEFVLAVEWIDISRTEFLLLYDMLARYPYGLIVIDLERSQWA